MPSKFFLYIFLKNKQQGVLDLLQLLLYQTYEQKKPISSKNKLLILWMRARGFILITLLLLQGAAQVPTVLGINSEQTELRSCKHTVEEPESESPHSHWPSRMGSRLPGPGPAHTLSRVFPNTTSMSFGGIPINVIIRFLLLPVLERVIAHDFRLR